MKNILEYVLAVLLIISPLVANSAELKFDFGSIKTGYADWDSGAKNVGRGSLYKIVADYGAVYDKGEFYSFYEHNKIDHATDSQNFTTAALGHYRINKSDYTIYGKAYAKFENTYSDELNIFFGAGYLGWSGEDGFFKPFVAIHNVSTDDASLVTGESANGFNGYVVGWNAAYFFKIFDEKFTLANWNEFEIERSDAYSENFGSQGSKFGINGALTLNWRFHEKFSTSVTYRYAQDKLGLNGWGDQMIYMLAYHF